MDPVSQAEEVFRETAAKALVEATRLQGEMILLSAITQKAHPQARLLQLAFQAGPDYTSGLLLGIGLTARNWGRVILNDGMYDFTTALLDDPDCDDTYAHQLVGDILRLRVASEVMELHRRVREETGHMGPAEWGRLAVHVIHIYAEMVSTALDSVRVDTGDC